MTQYEDIEARTWYIEYLNSLEIGERSYLYTILENNNS